MTEQTSQRDEPPVVDQQTWRKELDELRRREKAATRELDAIAAQRRRLPMVEMADYTLIGEDGPVRLADVFKGRSQLIVYNHMWEDGAEWQCGGCTGFTSQFTRLEFLDNYDARFVIVTNGPIEEALAYRDKVGNKMEWYSSSESTFGADVDAPPGAGFGVNVFLRDGDTVYRTWHTNGRGTEQLSHSFALIDILPWGRQEEWQDSPEGWPSVTDVLEVVGLAGHRAGLRKRLDGVAFGALAVGRQCPTRSERRECRAQTTREVSTAVPEEGACSVGQQLPQPRHPARADREACDRVPRTAAVAHQRLDPPRLRRPRSLKPFSLGANPLHRGWRCRPRRSLRSRS